ncbi:uncharacterized protein LOC130690065 [Daphnia carinata]|uniref:uncharacterized protein LOC130690065 n=1 Tax=Daphnia carinata TaxID=120202 RepID=UPI00257A869B|nr:uncharacterized protein LOC130690065 [Daphnia carinata]
MTSFPGNQQTYEYHAVDNFEVRLENRSSGCWSSSSVKLVQLCCIGILLPIVWILVPVYARLFSYANSAVPLTNTQMRMLDSTFSTFWCQGQLLQTNVTFDAYLMNSKPSAYSYTQHFTHHFELDDDLKEFWGFYLLEGSQLTISSCARYMGASVTVVKGNTSLKLLSCLEEGFTSSEEGSLERKKNITMLLKQNTSSNPSRKGQVEDGQSMMRNNIANGQPMLILKLDDDVEEIENGAFELADDEVVKEKDVLANPNWGGTSTSGESLTSSSEEALLACASPVMNQFVIPDENCNSTNAKHSLLRYVVDGEGYYSIIFSSNFEQNGQVKNPVSTEFDILQNVFNVTDAAASCHNTTECHFSLRFASNERVVVTLSTPRYDDGNGDWDSMYYIESQCIPRTRVYLAFGLTLPLVLILCAFL